MTTKRYRSSSGDETQEAGIAQKTTPEQSPPERTEV